MVTWGCQICCLIKYKLPSCKITREHQWIWFINSRPVQKLYIAILISFLHPSWNPNHESEMILDWWKHPHQQRCWCGSFHQSGLLMRLFSSTSDHFGFWIWIWWRVYELIDDHFTVYINITMYNSFRIGLKHMRICKTLNPTRDNPILMTTIANHFFLYWKYLCRLTYRIVCFWSLRFRVNEYLFIRKIHWVLTTTNLNVPEQCAKDLSIIIYNDIKTVK